MLHEPFPIVGVGASAGGVEALEVLSDRGRPLTDIVSHVETGDLRRDIRIVLERGQTMERSVARSDKSAQYLMRILPYRGRNNVIEGVLLTFFDLTNWSLKPIAGADGLLPAGRSK